MDLNQLYAQLGVLALGVFGYSLIAKRIESSYISSPIIYVVGGYFLGHFGYLGANSDIHDLRLLADLTLALILFADAANSNKKVLKQTASVPARMLLIGLPGAILLGTLLAAVLFSQLSIIEAAILGTMLAATDAALGKAVISDQSVPEPVREGLNVESGLNDGLCVPILLLLIALTSHGESVTASEAMLLMAEELGIGMAVGLSFSFVGAKLLQYCAVRGWVSEVWLQLTVGALAIASFAVAQTLHGSGYIAAFTGGMLFGHLSQKSTHKLVLSMEGSGELLAMLTWLLFGAVVITAVFDLFTPSILLYVALSLTFVRMIPVFLSFTGTKVSSRERLFMGWFGPRGLASVVFCVIVIDAEVTNAHFISLVVVCTVFVSLILHGVTAKPFASWLGRLNKPN